VSQPTLFEPKPSLTCRVTPDGITDELSAAYDYTFDGASSFTPPDLYVDSVPDQFSVGLIVGPSGSGKSTLLAQFGKQVNVSWDAHRAVCSHFESAEDARERLGAVGLNSIPSWMRPYHVLSTGEKFRADLARSLKHGVVIDEFTSVVDRAVAASCSNALRRYIDFKKLERVVLASCHYDIIEWLRPDWWYDTATHKMTNGRRLRRPEIALEVVPCEWQAWSMFSAHHYLSADINRGARCWLAVWNDRPVGFAATLALPNGSIDNGWREHRIVILPEFQGLGLGTRLSDAVARMHVDQGLRYFAKTAHSVMGKYRDASPDWRPTSKNHSARMDYLSDGPDGPSRPGTGKVSNIIKHAQRACYCHEYTARSQVHP
jgi:GNAT superfamily N-acetyltransferase